jgi:hypothetical protein
MREISLCISQNHFNSSGGWILARKRNHGGDDDMEEMDDDAPAAGGQRDDDDDSDDEDTIDLDSAEEEEEDDDDVDDEDEDDDVAAKTVEEIEARRLFQVEAEEIMEHLTLDDVKEVLQENDMDVSDAPKLKKILQDVVAHADVSTMEEAWEEALIRLEES